MPNDNFKSRAGQVTIPVISTVPVAVTAEAVTIPAGVAGSVVNFYIAQKPIFDSHHSFVGGFGDTSLVLTSTAFTTEVSPETLDANLTNGQYWVDYITGKCRGKKADASIAQTATYYVPTINTTLELGDIEIGTVELKNADTDERASIQAANTARTTATKVLATQNVSAAGVPLPSGNAADPIFVKETLSGTDVIVLNATGAVVMNTTTAIAAEFKLLKIVCHFSAAPVTSESLTVRLDSIAGAAYDTILYSLNPSLSAATDVVFLPDGDMKFKTGDELVVAFTNTDLRTYGLSIYYQLI